jgi:hypothetical protein
MQFAIFHLLIFLILTVVDVGTAVYTRYVLLEENQVIHICKQYLDLVNHQIMILKLTINIKSMVMSITHSNMTVNSLG